MAALQDGHVPAQGNRVDVEKPVQHVVNVPIAAHIWGVDTGLRAITVMRICSSALLLTSADSPRLDQSVGSRAGRDQGPEQVASELGVRSD